MNYQYMDRKLLKLYHFLKWPQLIGGDIKINALTNIKSQTYQKRELERQHKL